MIAIIPARGGSKGLPGKNIKNLLGKPLIAYTIEAALNSKTIERVIVSTDSEEIANVALEYGAEVPFMRPEKLATDDASAVDVYLYTINKIMMDTKQNIKEFIVLLPTTPLRTSNDIDKAILNFCNSEAETLVSVTEVHSPVEWYLTTEKKGYLVNAELGNNKSMKNRQDYSKLYEPNGAIYILNYELLSNKRTYYTSKTLPYVMNPLNSIDIDSLEDFKLIEAIMKSEV